LRTASPLLRHAHGRRASALRAVAEVRVASEQYSTVGVERQRVGMELFPAGRLLFSRPGSPQSRKVAIPFPKELSRVESALAGLSTGGTYGVAAALVALGCGCGLALGGAVARACPLSLHTRWRRVAAGLS